MKKRDEGGYWGLLVVGGRSKVSDKGVKKCMFLLINIESKEIIFPKFFSNF